LLLTEDNFASLAERVCGCVVSRIDRAVYRASDGQISQMFELQLWFGEDVERFRGAGNGETLDWDSTPLTDAHVTVSDRGDYIALVDVSGRAEYRDVVGATIARIIPLSNRFGRLIGVTFEGHERKLNVYVEGDDLHVTFGDAIPRW
jgi:hypothetical protein